jgi:hypothetical protein
MATICVRRSHPNNRIVSSDTEYARDLSVMQHVTEPMTTALTARDNLPQILCVRNDEDLFRVHVG